MGENVVLVALSHSITFGCQRHRHRRNHWLRSAIGNTRLRSAQISNPPHLCTVPLCDDDTHYSEVPDAAREPETKQYNICDASRVSEPVQSEGSKIGQCGDTSPSVKTEGVCHDSDIATSASAFPDNLIKNIYLSSTRESQRLHVSSKNTSPTRSRATSVR